MGFYLEFLLHLVYEQLKEGNVLEREPINCTIVRIGMMILHFIVFISF